MFEYRRILSHFHGQRCFPLGHLAAEYTIDKSLTMKTLILPTNTEETGYARPSPCFNKNNVAEFGCIPPLTIWW